MPIQADQLTRLLSAADDYEAVTIEDVALRAGLLWRCYAPTGGDYSCLYLNPEDVRRCWGCGNERPEEGADAEQ